MSNKKLPENATKTEGAELARRGRGEISTATAVPHVSYDDLRHADRITVEGLEVFANHGVYPEENALGQKFIVSLVLYADLRAAGEHDNLDASIDYGSVCHDVDGYLREHTFKLIEAAAEGVAQAAKVHAVEQRPAQGYQEQCQQVAHDAGDAVKEVPEGLFDDQQNAEVKAPHDKVPAGAMPETGKCPYHKDISDMFQSGDPITAKRDINIISEPASKRNMPASPEFRNTGGNIGIIKVLIKIKSQHFSQTDGHIRIAAEVKIEHQRIQKRSQPRAADRKLLHPHRLQGIERRPQQPRKQDLLGKANDKALRALEGRARRGAAERMKCPAAPHREKR